MEDLRILILVEGKRIMNSVPSAFLCFYFPTGFSGYFDDTPH